MLLAIMSETCCDMGKLMNARLRRRHQINVSPEGQVYWCTLQTWLQGKIVECRVEWGQINVNPEGKKMSYQLLRKKKTWCCGWKLLNECKVENKRTNACQAWGQEMLYGMLYMIMPVILCYRKVVESRVENKINNDPEGKKHYITCDGCNLVLLHENLLIKKTQKTKTKQNKTLVYKQQHSNWITHHYWQNQAPIHFCAVTHTSWLNCQIVSIFDCFWLWHWQAKLLELPYFITKCKNLIFYEFELL